MQVCLGHCIAEDLQTLQVDETNNTFSSHSGSIKYLSICLQLLSHIGCFQEVKRYLVLEFFNLINLAARGCSFLGFIVDIVQILI